MKFPNSFTSKLPQIGISIFAEMTQVANETKSINLSQGFPDFECSAELISLVNKYMKKGYNQYAPMPGVMKLREVIAEKTEKLYKAKYNPETEITVTAGATQAIYTAIAAVVREGDEVIVFEPAYDSYVPAIKLNGGIPVFVELRAPDYKINWEEVNKLVNQRTKLIILNSPHNPTGATINVDDIKNLEKITNNSEVIILSDEVYEHIVFDGHEHLSLSKYPKLAERTMVVCSFGKTLHATGWKIGYCLAPENLTAEFRKIHQFIVFACNTPLQHAIADYIKDENNYLEINEFYQNKRDYFNLLLKPSRFTIKPSSGTYFQLLSYENISDEKEKDFAIRMAKEFGIASIPISVFYHKLTENKMLRFCFAKSDKTLEKAAEKLCKI